MNEVEEFEKLMASVDLTEMSLIDQTRIVLAYSEMIAKVKPILLKHLASKNTGDTFLFKL